MEHKIRTLDEPSSERLRIIVRSQSLRYKFEALLLLEYTGIQELFKVSSEEIEEYKKKVFNTDYLVSLGKPFVVDYLENTKQDQTLDLYLGGIEYTLARFGYSTSLPLENKMIMKDKIVNSILVSGVFEKNIDTKIKCLKAIDTQVRAKEDTSPVVEKILDLFKDVKI